MPRNVSTYILCAVLALCFACTGDSSIKEKSGLQEPITASINDASFVSEVQPIATRHEALLYTEGIRIMRNGKEFKIYGMDVDHHPLLNRPDKSNADSPYETLFKQDDMDFFKINGFNLVPLHNILMDEMTDGVGNIN